MKRPRRSIVTMLFIALALVGVFGVAMAGCSWSGDSAQKVSSEAANGSQTQEDDLKTLNVGSDLFRPL